MKLKAVPEWSIVQLEDNQTCTVAHKTERKGKSILMFANADNNVYVDTNSDIVVRVLYYPAQLANRFLREQQVANGG